MSIASTTMAIVGTILQIAALVIVLHSGTIHIDALLLNGATVAWILAGKWKRKQ
jgi:hypothetical protein